MTIVWSPRALRDLNAHAARLDAFSEGSGLRLKADVVERLAQLDQPLSGRVVPEYMATFCGSSSIVRTGFSTKCFQIESK